MLEPLMDKKIKVIGLVYCMASQNMGIMGSKDAETKEEALQFFKQKLTEKSYSPVLVVVLSKVNFFDRVLKKYGSLDVELDAEFEDFLDEIFKDVCVNPMTRQYSFVAADGVAEELSQEDIDSSLDIHNRLRNRDKDND